MGETQRTTEWVRVSPPWPFPDNQAETKHVESFGVPRLDEGSIPSSSTVTAAPNVSERLYFYTIFISLSFKVCGMRRKALSLDEELHSAIAGHSSRLVSVSRVRLRQKSCRPKPPHAEACSEASMLPGIARFRVSPLGVYLLFALSALFPPGEPKLLPAPSPSSPTRIPLRITPPPYPAPSFPPTLLLHATDRQTEGAIVLIIGSYQFYIKIQISSICFICSRGPDVTTIPHMR